MLNLVFGVKKARELLANTVQWHPVLVTEKLPRRTRCGSCFLIAPQTFRAEIKYILATSGKTVTKWAEDGVNTASK